MTKQMLALTGLTSLFFLAACGNSKSGGGYQQKQQPQKLLTSPDGRQSGTIGQGPQNGPYGQGGNLPPGGGAQGPLNPQGNGGYQGGTIGPGGGNPQGPFTNGPQGGGNPQGPYANGPQGGGAPQGPYTNGPQGGGNPQGPYANGPQGGGNPQGPYTNGPQGGGNPQGPYANGPQGGGVSQGPYANGPQGGGTPQGPYTNGPQGGGNPQDPYGNSSVNGPGVIGPAGGGATGPSNPGAGGDLPPAGSGEIPPMQPGSGNSNGGIEPLGGTGPQSRAAWYPPRVQGSPAEAWLTRNVEPMLQTVYSSGPAPIPMSRRVKITLALGYFDGYHDEAGLTYGGAIYGQHSAVDPFLRAVVDQVLRQDCRSTRVQLCGFQLVGVNDVEALYRRIGLDSIIQEVRVLSGALSPRHDVNTRSQAEAQNLRSARAETIFSQSFEDSDLVVYVGHSRKGGGPDFRPPVLKNGKVDYPSYQKLRAGAQRTIRAVKSTQRRARAMALMSCDSIEHFAGELRQAGPNLQLATVRGLLHAEQLLTGGLASMDLFLRQGSLAGLPSFVAGTPVLGTSLQVRTGATSAKR